MIKKHLLLQFAHTDLLEGVPFLCLIILIRYFSEEVWPFFYLKTKKLVPLAPIPEKRAKIRALSNFSF